MRELLLNNAIPVEIPSVKTSMRQAMMEASEVDLTSGVMVNEFLDIFMQRLSVFGVENSINAEYIDVQPCNGAIHAFESFYLRNCDRRLRFFSGDFIYHQVIGRLPSLISPLRFLRPIL